jgi:flavin reductase (DIM6/NTAB) family NADH-FMN oxidoreductase RutF
MLNVQERKNGQLRVLSLAAPEVACIMQGKRRNCSDSPFPSSCERVRVFVVNIASRAQKEIFDYLGSHSGRDEDKLAKLGVKTENGVKVQAPILSDCPVNIECTVVSSIKTGSHEMFVGKIEYVHADIEIVKEDGAIDWDKISLL